MDFDKRYILFQFNACLDDKEFEEIRAIRFKYNTDCIDIVKEVKSYADFLCDEWTDKAWKAVRPDLEDLGADELYDVLKKFYINCHFCYEVITKEDYKDWKEEGKSSKLTYM